MALGLSSASGHVLPWRSTCKLRCLRQTDLWRARTLALPSPTCDRGRCSRKFVLLGTVCSTHWVSRRVRYGARTGSPRSLPEI
jgi:hypothetical protein